MPQHVRPGSKVPVGGNLLFVAASARWIKARNMYFLTTRAPGTRDGYFYQDDPDEMKRLLIHPHSLVDPTPIMDFAILDATLTAARASTRTPSP
jgi:hypothetical protein